MTAAGFYNAFSRLAAHAGPGPKLLLLEGGYVQWRPTLDRGAAGVLTLNRSDGPELDSNVPRLLAFKTPLLEDPSHIHTFIFESPEARAEAGRVLGL